MLAQPERPYNRVMGGGDSHDDSHAARWMAALYAARANYSAGVTQGQRAVELLTQAAMTASVLSDIDALPTCPEPDDPPGMLR